MTAACALILAASLSSTPGEVSSRAETSVSPAPLAAAIAAAPALETETERWMVDVKATRPAGISVMYGTLGVLQALDVYSTRRALRSGGTEVNPLVKPAIGSGAGMLALKAASTAGAIYFAERAWKKNRKGAIVMMAVVNGVTAAVVARNLRNAR